MSCDRISPVATDIYDVPQSQWLVVYQLRMREDECMNNVRVIFLFLSQK
jgi:hypothetical protein